MVIIFASLELQSKDRSVIDSPEQCLSGFDASA